MGGSAPGVQTQIPGSAVPFLGSNLPNDAAPNSAKPPAAPASLPLNPLAQQELNQIASNPENLAKLGIAPDGSLNVQGDAQKQAAWGRFCQAMPKLWAQLDKGPDQKALPTPENLQKILQFFKANSELALLPPALQKEFLSKVTLPASDQVLAGLGQIQPADRIQLAVRTQTVVYARQLASEGKMEQASREFERAVKFNPSESSLRMEGARAYMAWAQKESDAQTKETLQRAAWILLANMPADQAAKLPVLKLRLELETSIGKTEEATLTRSLIAGQIRQDFDREMARCKALLTSDPGAAAASMDKLKALMPDLQQFSSEALGDKIQDLSRLRFFYETSGNLRGVDYRQLSASYAASVKTLLGEIEKMPAETQEARLEKLFCQRDAHHILYRLENATPPVGVTTVDSNPEYRAYRDGIAALKKNVDGVHAQIEAEIQQIRASLTLPAGAAPSEAQLKTARTLIELDKRLRGLPMDNRQLASANQHLIEDLDAYLGMLNQVPRDGMPRQQLLNGYAELTKDWFELRTQVTDPMHPAHFPLDANAITEKMRGVRDRLLERADYIDSKDAHDNISELLGRLIDRNEDGVLSQISGKGLEEYAKACAAFDTQFDQAQKLADPKAKRTALMTILSNATQLRNSKSIDRAIQSLEEGMQSAPDTEKIQVYLAINGVLKGSGLSNERTMQDAGRQVADRLFSAPAPESSQRAKNLLLAKAYFESFPSEGILEVTQEQVKLGSIATELRGIRSNLVLSLGNKAPGTNPLDSVGLCLQIDQALLARDVEGAVKDEDAKKSLGELAVSSLGLYRSAILNAKDQPIEARLERLAQLAGMASTYTSLTKGKDPLISPDALKAPVEGIEGDLGSLYQELLTQDDAAPAEQKRIAAEIVADLKTRTHQALAEGKSEWLNSVSVNSLSQFAEYAQSAHLLLAEGKGATGAKAIELCEKSAVLFSQLGLRNRVSESLNVASAEIAKIQNPFQQAQFLFGLSNLYQQAGMKEEAGRVFDQTIALDVPGAPKGIHAAAQFARAFKAMNAGHLDEARGHLLEISDNPQAKLLMDNIEKGQKQYRVGLQMSVFRAAVLSYYEGKKGASWAKDRLDEIARQVAAGKADLYESARASFGDFLFETGPGDALNHYLQSAPFLNDQDLAKSTLRLAKRMVSDDRFTSATQIAQLLVENPFVGEEAKKVIEDEIPAEAKWDSIKSAAHGLLYFTPLAPVVAFADVSSPSTIGEENSETHMLQSVKGVGINAATAIVPFAFARWAKVGVEAAFVARAATLIENPVALKVAGFFVGTTTEAGAFTVSNMMLQSLFTGSTANWKLKNFGKEFGSMMVTFVLLHGVNVGMQRAGRAAENVPWMQAGAEEAAALRQSGKLALSPAGQKAFGAASWAVRVGSFTGAEFVNEGLGLKEHENVPLWMKLMSSAITDAQMIKAGKAIDVVTGGRISRVEQQTQMRYKIHEMLPALKAMGFELDAAQMLNPKKAGEAAPTPAEAVLYQLIQSSVQNGEAPKVPSDTAQEAHRIIQDVMKLDPKSPQGQKALALLMGYSIRAGGANGALSGPELQRSFNEIEAFSKKLAKDCGIEHDKLSGNAAVGIARLLLSQGWSIESVQEHAADLRDRVMQSANELLGPGGAKTPEGQQLVTRLLLHSLRSAKSPEELGTVLEKWTDAVGPEGHNSDVNNALRKVASSLTGKPASRTPEGRAIVADLMLKLLEAGGTPEDIQALAARASDVENDLTANNLFKLSDLHKPEQKLGLIYWCMQRQVSGSDLREIAAQVKDGKMHFEWADSGIRLLRGEQVYELRPEDIIHSVDEGDMIPENGSRAPRPDAAAREVSDSQIISIADARPEREIQREIRTRNIQLKAERAGIEKLADPAERARRLGALEAREKAFSAELEKARRAADGRTYEEVMPELAKLVSDPFLHTNGHADRARIHREVAARLEALHMRLSTDNDKAIDSMIDLAMTARSHGIIGKGGLTPGQFHQVIGELYLHDNPALRIGSAELTHVPMVAEGTLNHYERLMAARGESPTIEQKKAMFLAALLHDAGKWDPSIRTETGYTVLANSPFNKSGRDIVVQPAESLAEAMKSQNIDAAQVALPFPGMAAVLVHHDASNVRARVHQLVEKGIIPASQENTVWQSIQYHGFVSSWIVNNSMGGLGIKSHVFNEPKLQDFFKVYQRVSQKMGENGISDFNALMNDPAFSAYASTLRGAFNDLPLEVQALMLGDHQGQIDLAKYMTILSGSPANKDASVHDLFFGNSMVNSLSGVLRTHQYEQAILSPEMGAAAKPAFDAAEAWLHNPASQNGLSRTILDNPELKSQYQAWRKAQSDPSQAGVLDWLKSVPVKRDGKPSPEFQKIQQAVEKSFYQFYAIEGSRGRFEWNNPESRNPAEGLHDFPLHENVDRYSPREIEDIGQRAVAFQHSFDSVARGKNPPLWIRDAAWEARNGGRLTHQNAKEVIEAQAKMPGLIRDIRQKEGELHVTEDPSARRQILSSLGDLYLELDGHVRSVDRWKAVNEEASAYAKDIIRFTFPYARDSVRRAVRENLKGQADKASFMPEEPDSPVKFSLQTPDWSENLKLRSDFLETELGGPEKPENYTVLFTVKTPAERASLLSHIQANPESAAYRITADGPSRLDVRTPNGKHFRVEVKLVGEAQERAAEPANVVPLRRPAPAREDLRVEEDVAAAATGGFGPLERSAPDPDPLGIASVASHDGPSQEITKNTRVDRSPGRGFPGGGAATVLAILGAGATLLYGADAHAAVHEAGRAVAEPGHPIWTGLQYAAALLPFVGMVIGGGRGGRPEAPVTLEIGPGVNDTTVFIGKNYGHFTGDDSVSRAHCTLYRTASGQWAIQDGTVRDGALVPSSNGVKLRDAAGNETRIPRGGTALLQDGQVVVIGQSAFRFKAPAPAAPEPVSPRGMAARGDAAPLSPRAQAAIDTSLYPSLALPSTSNPREEFVVANGAYEAGSGEPVHHIADDGGNSRPTAYFSLRTDASGHWCVYDGRIGGAEKSPYGIEVMTPAGHRSRVDGFARVSPGDLVIYKTAQGDRAFRFDGQIAPTPRRGDPSIIYPPQGLPPKPRPQIQGRAGAPDMSPLPLPKLAPEQVGSKADALPTYALSDLPAVLDTDLQWKSKSDASPGVAFSSHEGIGYKDHNEDRYFMITLGDGRTVTFAIDGMGGHKGGEKAAEIVRLSVQRAVAEGASLPDAIEIARRTVRAENEKTIEQRRQGGIREKNLEDGLPGAVAVGVSTKPLGDGKFEADFVSIGDAEAIVIRLPKNGQGTPSIPFWTARPSAINPLAQGMKTAVEASGRRQRSQTLVERLNPMANMVDGGIGLNAGRIYHDKATLEEGDIIISGSDGFFENFGTFDEIAKVIQYSGQTTPSGIRDALMAESLLRMQLIKMNRSNLLELTHETYQAAYKEVFKQEPPPGWRGMYESDPQAVKQLRNDSRYFLAANGEVALIQDIEFPSPVVKKDANNVPKAITHFKRDNVTVGVQILEQEAAPPPSAPKPDANADGLKGAARSALAQPIVSIGDAAAERPSAPTNARAQVSGMLFGETPVRNFGIQNISNNNDAPTWVSVAFGDRPQLIQGFPEGPGTPLFRIWGKDGRYYLQPQADAARDGFSIDGNRRSLGQQALMGGHTYRLKIGTHEFDLNLPTQGRAEPPVNPSAIPVHIQMPPLVSAQGVEVGVICGGIEGLGMGRLIPKDGSVVKVGDNFNVRYNRDFGEFEYQKPGGVWQVLKTGQTISNSYGAPFVFVDMKGYPPEGLLQAGGDGLRKALGQYRYHLATEGVKQHIQKLQNEGQSVGEIDGQNMAELFRVDPDKIALTYDSGNALRTQGGIFGGRTQVYAMVDSQTGRIYRIATRDAQPSSPSARSERWAPRRNPQDGKLYWAEKTYGINLKQPVDVSGLPLTAVPVTLVYERMTGKMVVEETALNASGLSGDARQRMRNLSGLYVDMGSAALQPVFNGLQR